jgi:hypothetical protein
MATDHNFKVKNGLSVGNTEIIDSSGNLTNIGTVSSGNITTTGYLRGPSTFTIDPAAHGDDTGTVVIAGNLQVDGTTTTINSTTVTLDDKNIVLASGAANGAAANGAGITIDGVNATLTYDNGDGNWLFNKALHMVGTQRITTGGFAGIEYHNTDGTWELFVGTENNTGNARYNSRQGSHKFYSNSGEIAHLSSAGLTLDGVMQADNGYKVGSNTVIDSSRNLINLNGSIKSDTTFAFLTNADGAQNIRTKSVFAGTSYGDTPPAGSFNATNTYELNGTTVIDSSRNLTSIGTISSGAITSTGNMSLTGELDITKSASTHSLILANRDNFADSSDDSLIWITSGASGGFKSGAGAHLVFEGRKENRNFYFKVGNVTAPQHIMHSNGYVGFGTGDITPTDRVHVDGTVRATSYKVGTTTVISSSRNLTSIGTISSGAITSSAKISASSDLETATRLAFTNNIANGWSAPIIFRESAHLALSDYSGVKLGGYNGTAYGPRFHVAGNGNVNILEGSLMMGGTTVIDSSRNIYAAAVTASSIVSSDNVAFGNSGNISMDSSANGQVEIKGSGYQGAIALDATGMRIYHNSSQRSLVLGTNETARLTINGSGTFDFHDRDLTNIGVIALRVSGSDSAHQRVDVRDETGDQSRAHWYGVNATGGTANFRHAWYDGSSYVNVTAASSTVTFGGHIGVSGNGSELLFSGGNNRIKFSGYRALEGNTTGTTLQLAEGYGSTTVQSHLNMQSGYEIKYNGTTVIDSSRNLTNIANLTATGLTTLGRTASDRGSVSDTNTALIVTSRGVDHTSSRTNVLRLQRDGTSGVVYAGLADIDLERWESSDVASRTAMHFRLGHGNLNSISETTVPTVMTLRSNGMVGIGTTAPSKPLHVKTSLNEGIFLEGTSNGVWMDVQSGASELWSMGADTSGWAIYNRTDSAYRLRCENGGDVDVVTGGLKVGGTTIIDSSLNIGAGGASDSNYDLKVHGLARFQGAANFVSATNPIQVGGTTVIDASRNLTNIGTISSGAITSSGLIATSNSLHLGSNYNLSWGGAYGSGNPTIAANSNTIYFYPTGNVSGQRLYLNAAGLTNAGTFTSGAITATTIKETDGGDGFTEIGSSNFGYFSWGVEIANTSSAYRGIRFAGKKKYFVLEADVLGTSGANHTGMFWGNADGAAILSGSTTGYKTTHQNSTLFHIRDINGNGDQETYNPGFSPADGAWHHQKIMATPDGYVRIWIDGDLKFEETGYIPSAEGYLGFINYAGTVRYANIRCRTINEDEAQHYSQHIGNSASPYADDDRFLKLANSTANSTGTLVTADNGNTWLNADGGKDLWLNWASLNNKTSYADLRVGGGNYGSAIMSVIGATGLIQQNFAGNVVDGSYYSGYTMNITGTSTFGGMRFDRNGTAMYRVGMRSDDKFQIANFNLSSGVDDQFVIDTSGTVGIGTGTNLGNGTLNVESNGISVLQARANTAGLVDGDTTVVVSRAVNSNAGKWAHAIYRGYTHAWSYGGSASSNEAMRITNTGRVRINNNTSGWDSLGTLVVKQVADNVGIGVVDDNSSNTFQMRNNGGYAEMHYNVNLPIIFSQSGGERMRIDNDGNIEIAKKIEFAVTSGTLISHGSFTDAIGYNGSYGTYIGGGGRYVYSGGSGTSNGGTHPYYYDGTAVQNIHHNGGQIANTFNGDHTFTNATSSTGIKVTNDQTGGPAIKIHSTNTNGTDWWLISNSSSNTNGAGKLQLWSNNNSFTAATFGETANNLTSLYTPTRIHASTNTNFPTFMSTTSGSTTPTLVANANGQNAHALVVNQPVTTHWAQIISTQRYGLMIDTHETNASAGARLLTCQIAGNEHFHVDTTGGVFARHEITAGVQDTQFGHLILRAGNGDGANIDAYSENGSQVHCDVRDSGNYSKWHKYTRIIGGSYGAYEEAWWDGNSYHNIKVASNAWRFDSEIVSSSNITAYGSYSDINLKENIVPVNDALSLIKDLGVYRFNYKGRDDTLIGVIAQEVEETLPEIVYEVVDDDNIKRKAVRYEHLAGVLLKAVQQQQDEIDELKAQVKKLMEK